MYVTREIEFINSFRSGAEGGGGGQQMWAVVNKPLMHSIFYMLKFPRQKLPVVIDCFTFKGIFEKSESHLELTV